MLLRLLRIPLIALIALAVVIAPRLAAAQDATPEPITAIELAPGVTAEALPAPPLDRAPGQTVYLARFVFQPGAELFPHNHPGTTVVGVASGSLS